MFFVFVFIINIICTVIDSCYLRPSKFKFSVDLNKLAGVNYSSTFTGTDHQVAVNCLEVDQLMLLNREKIHRIDPVRVAVSKKPNS